MSRIPEDTMSAGLPGETVQPAPRTRREARERYRGSERRQARGLPSTSTGARSLRQAAKPGASLGAGYLGLGAAVLTGIEAVAGIVFFLIRWTEFTNPWLPAAAWALYLIAAVGVGLSLLTYGERLTGPAFVLICVVLGCVVTLDFIGIWPEHDIAHTASASVAAGFALLPIATLRPAREVAAAIAVLGLAFVAMAVASTPITSDTLPAIVSTVALVTVPPSIALFVVHRFRQLVQRELDRVLVQSNVGAPQFAVGMLASDELARLDLAAEKLLDAVANGSDPLPLSDASRPSPPRSRPNCDCTSSRGAARPGSTTRSRSRTTSAARSASRIRSRSPATSPPRNGTACCRRCGRWSATASRPRPARPWSRSPSARSARTVTPSPTRRWTSRWSSSPAVSPGVGSVRPRGARCSGSGPTRTPSATVSCTSSPTASSIGTRRCSRRTEPAGPTAGHPDQPARATWPVRLGSATTAPEKGRHDGDSRGTDPTRTRR